VNIDRPRDGDKRETWQMNLLLLAAAAVGLGAIVAGNVVPDVTRYLRIRRM
jgi:nitroreductase